MSRFEKFALLILFLAGCLAYVTVRYFRDARLGRLRRLLVGILGGLLLWALYATIAWRIVSG